MTKTTNDTDYGYAANGTHVGSGFDVEVKRASRNSALVCVTSLATKQEWMTRLDVEQDADLQALAFEIGNCPELGNGGWVSYSSDEWSELAEEWDAIQWEEAIDLDAAREYVATHEDDDDMDEDELADVFVQVYGRKPDAKDRRDGVWSLICAGI